MSISVLYWGMMLAVWFVIGAGMGSVANALIDRLPRGESWVKGRSHCDKCGHVLNIFDLIPLLSFVWLRGFVLNQREGCGLQGQSAYSPDSLHSTIGGEITIFDPNSLGVKETAQLRLKTSQPKLASLAWVERILSSVLLRAYSAIGYKFGGSCLIISICAFS